MTAEKQSVKCPFCGAEQEESIPDGTKWGFAHPVDGDWRAKTGKEWVINPPEQCPWWKQVWYKFVYGQQKRTKEKIIARMAQCKNCSRRFHLEFFENAEKDDDAWWTFHGDSRGKPVLPRITIDRLLDRGPFPYVLTSMVVGIIPWASWFVVLTIFGGWDKVGYEWVSWVFSCVMFVMMLITVKSHANMIRGLSKEVEHIPDLQEWMRKYIVRGWVKHSLGDIGARFKAPDFFGYCLAFVYIIINILLLLFNRDMLYPIFEPHSIAFYAEFVVTTIIWAFFYFILGTSLYLSLSIVWLMKRIGNDIPMRVNPLDRSGGLAPFGKVALSSVLSLTPPLLIGTFLFGFSVFLGQQAVSLFMRIALLLGGVGIAVGVFFIALYSIHHIMKEKKTTYAAHIFEAWDKEFEKLMGKVGDAKMNRRDFSIARQLSYMYKDIAKMREWPYEFGTLVTLFLSIGSQMIISLTLIAAAVLLGLPLSLF